VARSNGNHPGEGASRRDFLRTLAIGGAAATMPAGELFAQRGGAAPVTIAKRRRIDVHAHFTSPKLIEVVGRQELGNFANWTPEIALQQMEEFGIETGMISVPPHYDPATVDIVARPTNEHGARVVQDHRGRFGLMAFLPLPHIDTTLKEIEYVFDTLKADGVATYTNYGDKWIGDKYFDPVMEELNRRRAVVFTHPISADCCKSLLPNVGDGTIEWQTDTTRAIANVLFNGAATRYPNVRFIFSHGGGTMPYLVERFEAAARNQRMAQYFPQGFSGAAGKLYYDTAWTANKVAMTALKQVVPLSQIVLGTDYPARAIGDHVKGLAECGVYSAQELDKVERENALMLFPRFRT
jgi:predicted TIM-barrel fold metal-dependent hydrolase